MLEIFKIIFQSLTHAVREFQIYILSGFLIILNIRILTHFCSCDIIGEDVNTLSCSVFAIILSYILGNISMGLFCFLFRKKNGGYRFYNQPEADQTKLHLWYQKHQKEFQYFIERYSILVEMRFNMSAAFAINVIVNIIYLFCFGSNENITKSQIVALSVGYALAAIVLYKLSIVTEDDFNKKIKNWSDFPIV